MIVKKSNFEGSATALISTANQQLIVNGMSYSDFSFYNNANCVVKINKSDEIFLFKGQGISFNNKLESIFSFEIVTAGVEFNFIGYK